MRIPEMYMTVILSEGVAHQPAPESKLKRFGGVRAASRNLERSEGALWKPLWHRGTSGCVGVFRLGHSPSLNMTDFGSIPEHGAPEPREEEQAKDL